MIDIHTHLYFPDFEGDRDEVVRRAREAGIGFMVSVGTDPEDNRKAIGIAESYDGIRAAVGLHPHFFDRPEIDGDRMTAEIGSLKRLAGHPKVVAIGECGLDYFSRDPKHPVSEERKKRQREGFLAQTDIAGESGLPIIIHTRPSAGTMDAYEDMFGILSDPDIGGRKQKFVLHCYQGDTEMTKKFLGLPNVHFSFAGSVTYPVKKSLEGTKDDAREVVKLVSSDRLFVETDCPFLSPQPKRGERNEPAFVFFTAERVAAIKGVSADDIAAATERTARSVFGDFEVYCGREE